MRTCVAIMVTEMRVKLVRKFANVINGIDLTNLCVGEVLDLKDRDASMLIAEGWAEPAIAVRASHPESGQQIESAESGG